jgi:CHASE2 domain-containing sensor protein
VDRLATANNCWAPGRPVASRHDLYDRAPLRNRTLLIGAIAALASLANPLGWKVWSYALAVSTNPAVTVRITEWQPTSLRTVTGFLFFASAAAIAAFLARRRQATSWPSLVWLAVFFVIGAFAERGVAWWPLVAAFLMRCLPLS